jgi:3-isopropylmalate/(R)-2-methylmalate dehydratase small subunit
MQPLTTHRGLVAPLPRRDIDTDQIVPKQFLKSIERAGFGRCLFYDWRVRPDGSPHPDFVLNQPRYAGASILVAGANFGCGSSREHAAWALQDFGFRVIIAPSFADIFRANAVTNGILPVVLPHDRVTAIAHAAQTVSGYCLDVNLSTCRVQDADGLSVSFDIDEPSRHRLLHGLDDIAVILQYEAAIARYEAAHRLPG